MAASASNTTTGQYPICIENIDFDKIHCDEAKLKDHLTHKLNYNENDAARIFQQITGHIKQHNLSDYFWYSAAKNMSTEAIRVLLHSIEHSQLIRLLSYGDVEYGHTALRWCAANRRNEVIKVILASVSENECYQLLSITDNAGRTPLHFSCLQGDAESVNVMLNHINQDMRFSLLQMTDIEGFTPLHEASQRGHADVMKVIHETVTQTQWINLLHMKDEYEMTALQSAVWYKQSCVKIIRDSVSDEVWLQLVSTPPEYNEVHQYNDDFYQGAVDMIDELRAAARVKSVLQTENISGILSCHDP